LIFGSFEGDVVDQLITLINRFVGWFIAIDPNAVIATFTVVLAWVGWRQVRDTRILQRAYLSVGPDGIDHFKSKRGPPWRQRGACGACNH